jgi:iron(III) transport system permease protein
VPEAVERPPEQVRVPPRTRALRAGQVLFFAVAVALIAYFVVVPLVFLIWRGVTTDAGLSLQNFVAAFSVSGTVAMVVNSVVFAVGTAVLSTVTGTALAYICARTNAPLKPVMYATSVVPLIIPGILFTISWIFLLSDDIGILNVALRSIGLGFIQLNVFSLPGMILVEGLHLSPIVFLLMYAAFRATDPALEESALMSGASVPKMIRRVTLPMVRPSLFAAILVMLVRGLESFETPALLGIPAGRFVFTSQIYQALNTFPVRYDRAAIYSLTLIAITAAGLAYVQVVNRQAERYQTITGKGFRPRPLDLGRWRWPVSIVFVAYFLFVVVAPLAVLIYVSLLPFFIPPSFAAIQQFTLDNYRFVFELPNVVRAFRNSIILSIGSATFLMLFITVVAWLVVKSKMRGRRLLDTLTSFPLAYPGVVLGVALIFVYLRVPVPVYGTLWILFIVYVTRYLPYAMRYATSSMGQIGAELEESARMSGAEWWDTFRRVLVPLMMPGIVAGWVYVVIVSIRELSASILLYSPGTEVFSVVIWELWEAGRAGELAAVGVVLVFGLMVMVGIAYRLGANVGVKE